MKYVMMAFIRFYRRVISPLKPPCCRFSPTCSQYALEAYAKRGFFVGSFLTAYRILRCNPFCKGGFDPVPERKPSHRKHGELKIDLPLTDNEANLK